MNATKHSLADKELVLRDEDPAELDALRADLIAERQPLGQTEALLVEDLAVCWWRLQRARRCEVTMIRYNTLALQAFEDDKIAGIQRYTASAERGWHRALNQLRATQNDRRKCQQEPTEPAPAAQPQETEKVIAVGPVLQNEPDAPKSEPSSNPDPPTLTTTYRPPAATQEAEQYAQEEEIMARYGRIDAFLTEAKREQAKPRV